MTMKSSAFRTLLASMVFVSSCFSANAQKTKSHQTKSKTKAERTKVNRTAVAESESPTLNTADFLASVAKIIVVDSVVADDGDFMKHIPVGSDCGRIETEEKNGSVHSYVNGFDDHKFESIIQKDGKRQLMSAEKIGGQWGELKVIPELNGSFSEADYPFLMADGVTLYFSAINKENSFGKRDIFMARFDTDSMTFYKPENIGLPFNSKANDYMCVIDDMNNIGWLVTDRHQPEGKVCVYTFIPSDERWESDGSLSERKLAELAEIHSVRDSQYDKEALNMAKARLKELIQNNSCSTAGDGFPFVINDDRVCLSENDFKMDTSRQLFKNLSAMKKELSDKEDKLNGLKSSFNRDAKQNVQLTEKIRNLEADIEKLDDEIKKLEKKIRNAENLL